MLNYRLSEHILCAAVSMTTRPAASGGYSWLVTKAITAQLVGGLGNQLFTYCAASAVAASHNVPLHIDLRRIAHGVGIDKFDLPGSWTKQEAHSSARHLPHDLYARTIRRLSRDFPKASRFLKYYEPTYPGYDPLLMQVRPGTKIRGYFQSWQNVEMAYEFGTPRVLRLHYESTWLQEMIQQAREQMPIAVHIRRGDYTSSDGFGLLDASYYEGGLQALREQGLSGPIWVFSDDLDAAARVLSEPFTSVLSPVGPQEELVLMSQASGFVTANSSFSWWGSWLSRGRPVVAPTVWFKSAPEPQGLIPPWWTRIPSYWQ